MRGEIGILQEFHRKDFLENCVAKVRSDRQRTIINLKRGGHVSLRQMAISEPT